MSVSEPGKIITPWATSGLKNPIPPAANPATGRAGFDQGFPAINMTAKEAGGIPPFGQDFNGIFYEVTNVLRYMQAGGQPTFDAALATAIGGYPKGAMVLGSDGLTLWQSKVDSNTENPNVSPLDWSKIDINLRNDLVSGDGGSLVCYTPDQVPSLTKISIEQALLYRKNITDLGAVSGVPSAIVDSRVVTAVDAGYCITLPHGFDYKTAGTLVMPSSKPVFITCPDGRAKVSATAAVLMFDSTNTFKFQGSYFENIRFVGADSQNVASQFMWAPEPRFIANFTTKNCSWEGFHTVFKGAMIAVKNYQPTYYGCGDTGAIADSYGWTSALFSSFNLNEWHEPVFMGKFGRLFKILGGYSNYFYHPWFEKVETVSDEMFLIRQHFNLQFIGGWLENFKTKFLVNFDGDGTENTASDIVLVDGLHINNNWSLDSAHAGEASGFVALFNILQPQNPGGYYDTKLTFRNMMEHGQSVAGWALSRTNATLNAATSISEMTNNHLKAGQPNMSDGLVLAGSLAEVYNHFRNLSSNRLNLTPSDFQIISGVNKAGQQKELIFDNAANLIYLRNNGVIQVRVSSANFAPGVTNTMLCGVSSLAWAGGFTQAAFTVTSDENYKTPAQAIMDKLLDAWAEVQFVTYQFLDRVEVKGPDGARWHFGVVAQRVVEALERHGLDWTQFAFICFDKWDASPATCDDDGSLMSEAVEAGEKFGIRYEEALVLEAALQRRNYQRLLDRVEALESR